VHGNATVGVMYEGRLCGIFSSFAKTMGLFCKRNGALLKGITLVLCMATPLLALCMKGACVVYIGLFCKNNGALLQKKWGSFQRYCLGATVHGEANVSALERGRVVGAVTRHCYYLYMIIYIYVYVYMCIYIYVYL